MGFNARVFTLVRQVPRGRVVAYGDVAAAMGCPRAARQVGRALASLGRQVPEGPPVPWQRVVRSSGELPCRDDPLRWERWRALLAAEGVLLDGGRVPMSRYRWRPELGEWICWP